MTLRTLFLATAVLFTGSMAGHSHELPDSAALRQLGLFTAALQAVNEFEQSTTLTTALKKTLAAEKARIYSGLGRPGLAAESFNRLLRLHLAAPPAVRVSSCLSYRQYVAVKFSGLPLENNNVAAQPAIYRGVHLPCRRYGK